MLLPSTLQAALDTLAEQPAPAASLRDQLDRQHAALDTLRQLADPQAMPFLASFLIRADGDLLRSGLNILGGFLAHSTALAIQRLIRGMQRAVPLAGWWWLSERDVERFAQADEAQRSGFIAAFGQINPRLVPLVSSHLTLRASLLQPDPLPHRS